MRAVTDSVLGGQASVGVDLHGARILVSGGCGSIGSRIASLLVKLGAEVRIVDHLRAYPFDYRARFAAGDAALRQAEITVGDIRDADVVRQALSGVTHVVHAAAFADVGAAIRQYEEDFSTNVMGTQQLLRCAAGAKVERIVFLSSASVYGQRYGDPGSVCFSEDDATRPLSTYANSKLWAEHQMRLFFELYGMETVSIRIFSAYGPPQVPKRGSHSWCVAFFTMRALKGRTIEVFGSGQQVRDFVHVEDIARATALALTCARAVGGVFNIGTGIPTRVGRLADMVNQSVTRVGIVHRPPKVGDPTGGYADASRARAVLDWSPRIPLSEGLEHYVAWVRSNSDLIPPWL